MPENAWQSLGLVAGNPKMTNSISLLLLTAGRGEFLRECVESIRRQSRPPLRLVAVNDGPAISREVENLIRSVCPQVDLEQTPRTQSGQWAAFRQGLKVLGKAQPFAIVHDDDRLKPDYVETLTKFASRQKRTWICSHNLEVFYEESKEIHPILPKETQPFVLRGRAEVCLRYSYNFVPFPGTCFGLPASELATRLHEEYREMADVVLMCECAQEADVFYEPRPIYEYRRHGSQVSDRMDHSMEDQLQDYLLQKTQGTHVMAQVGINLERRRAERYFAWAWETGRFSSYPFRKEFSWELAFRAVRNRKCKAAGILLRELAARFRSPSATNKNPAA